MCPVIVEAVFRGPLNTLLDDDRTFNISNISTSALQYYTPPVPFGNIANVWGGIHCPF